MVKTKFEFKRKTCVSYLYRLNPELLAILKAKAIDEKTNVRKLITDAVVKQYKL